MNERAMDRESALQERVNILRTKGYRGFEISGSTQKPKHSVEVGASNKAGVELIAVGDTLDEAYENLIERIDITLDG